MALATRGDQDPATQELEAAIKAQPNEPMYHLTFAHWLNAWKVRGAAPHLDAARDLAKDDYGLLASIGFEYRMAGEFDSCIKTFDRTIAIKDGGEVRTERALCKLGTKDEKGTLDDLQAAVAKEPELRAGALLPGRPPREHEALQGGRGGVREVPRARAERIARQAGDRAHEDGAGCGREGQGRRRPKKK